jgi:hypothetical protein
MDESDFSNITIKDGFAGDLKGFLEKLNLIFMINSKRFENDETKVI